MVFNEKTVFTKIARPRLRINCISLVCQHQVDYYATSTKVILKQWQSCLKRLTVQWYRYGRRNHGGKIDDSPTQSRTTTKSVKKPNRGTCHGALLAWRIVDQIFKRIVPPTRLIQTRPLSRVWWWRRAYCRMSVALRTDSQRCVRGHY